MTKVTSEHYLPVQKLAQEYGYSDTFEFLEAECQDSVMPACCTHGCEVEPDGTCEHGCPSPLLLLGFI